MMSFQYSSSLQHKKTIGLLNLKANNNNNNYMISTSLESNKQKNKFFTHQCGFQFYIYSTFLEIT